MSPKRSIHDLFSLNLEMTRSVLSISNRHSFWEPTILIGIPTKNRMDLRDPDRLSTVGRQPPPIKK